VSRAAVVATATVVMAVLLLGTASSVRAAEPEGTPFRLEYEASAACPDRDAFVREILARTTRPRLVTGDDARAIAMRVVIETKNDASSSGRLDVREPDGTSETRSVTSRTCSEVAAGLALVAALVLDPDARTDAEPTRPLPEPVPSTDAPTTTRPTRPTPPTTPTTPTTPPSPSDRSVARTPLPLPAPESWTRATAGAQVGFLGGIGPALAPMIGAFIDLEHKWRRGPSSAVRLGFDVAQTQSGLAQDGTQAYEWFGGSVRLCPLYVALSQHWRAAPCAAMQIAAHRATAQRVPNPTSSTDAWLAPAAIATLEWAISREIGLELHGGALFPLLRSRYFLAPNTTIFEVPAVAPTAGFALRVRIL
jgi:hypothetical protein